MRFKKLAIEMRNSEVKRCMSILVEGSEIIRIRRDQSDNSIHVKFTVFGEKTGKEYVLTLLSDSVIELTEDIPFRIDGKYLYQQYMIANGYSETWCGNIFVNEESSKDKNERNCSMKELERFLKWIAGNHDLWETLCDPAFAEYTYEQKQKLFEELEKEGFLSVAYLMFHQSSGDSRQMEIVREKVQNKAIAEMPAEKVLELIVQSLGEQLENDIDVAS